MDFFAVVVQRALQYLFMRAIIVYDNRKLGGGVLEEEDQRRLVERMEHSEVQTDEK
jgi:hypothetical protein